MAIGNEKLNRLTIGSPCESSWEGMRGDERERHCLECGRTVHNLACLTPRQIAALIEASQGHFCARLTRNSAGRLVTGELVPPELSPAGSLRASPVAAAVVGGLLAFANGSAAGPPRAPSEASVPGSPDAAPEETRRERPALHVARVSGRAVNEDGVPLPGVTVTARPALGSRERSEVTDRDGRFAFDALTDGVYDFEAQLEGFVLSPRPDVHLRPGERREIDFKADAVKVEVITVGGAMPVSAEPLHRAFEQSEVVVLATAGPSTVVEQNKDYSEVVTELFIRSTFKGRTPQRSIRVYHAESGPVAERKNNLPAGTEVLAFLTEREGELGRIPAYESADYHFGLKTDLSAAEIRAYGKRLLELAPLYLYGEPPPADLLEWLVATAEEPLTRHEATGWLGYQLEREAELLGELPFDPDGLSEPTQRLTAFLSGEQKERLSAAFQRAPRFTEAEAALFAIVHSWAGEQAIPWLADRLENGDLETGELGFEILDGLAEVLDDDELRGWLTAAEDELKAYEETLNEVPGEERSRQVERRATALEKRLRHRFVQALRERP